MEKGQFEASATLTAELNAARDKIGALTTSLLNRTDELRTLDNRRSEAVTEMELVQAREKDLKAALEEHKRAAEQERLHWKEELRHLRELLQRRMETVAWRNARRPRQSSRRMQLTAQPVTTTAAQPAKGGGSAHVIPRGNPVLGSIVQQFDKLRQQRASDRNSANKSK